MRGMTAITMKFSQAVVDQQHALETQNSAYADSLAALFGKIGTVQGDLNPGQAVSSTLNGSTLTVRYTSGATETYKNVVLDNPGAASGHGSATDYELDQTGVAEVLGKGNINFDYKVDGGNVWLYTSSLGDTFNSMVVATDVLPGNAKYDPVFGNVGVGLRGNLTLTPQGQTVGSFTNITLFAQKFLDSSSIDGNFYMDTSRPDSLGGVMTGYKEVYLDGSTLQLSGISSTLNPSQNLSNAAWSDVDYYSGDDVINVDLPAHVYAPMMVQAGSGNDRITLNGGGGQLGVMAGSGNDQITLLGGSHTVDGGGGIDTVRLNIARADATIQRGTSATSYTLTDKTGAVDQLTGVERVVFADAAVALDIDGNAGQVYRIYQAALNRTPDKAGLGFWINALDHGQTLASVAQGFLDSPEYHKAYDGVTSNRELVNRYYENILHRTPDAGGLDFWAGVLDSKAAGTADVLASISDSNENKVGVIGVIGNGFEYTPYGQG
jgi:hypothetical protein